MNTTRIIKKLLSSELKNTVINHEIVVGFHALERLSEGQRKLFKVDDLIKPLQKEKPVLAGIQKNGYYSVYFRRKEGYLKMIFNIKPRKVEIVTFMCVDSLPDIR